MKNVLVYLRHIRDAFDLILEYTQNGRDSIFESTLIRDGVILNLVVVGEATKNIPVEFRTEHPEIPWMRMAGMRDVIVHRYKDIDLDVVWDVVENYIPDLYPKIDRLIHELSERD